LQNKTTDLSLKLDTVEAALTNLSDQIASLQSAEPSQRKAIGDLKDATGNFSEICAGMKSVMPKFLDDVGSLNASNVGNTSALESTLVDLRDDLTALKDAHDKLNASINALEVTLGLEGRRLAEADTVTITVDTIEGLREELRKLEYSIEAIEAVIKEVEAQIELVKQDAPEEVKVKQAVSSNALVPVIATVASLCCCMCLGGMVAFQRVRLKISQISRTSRKSNACAQPAEALEVSAVEETRPRQDKQYAYFLSHKKYHSKHGKQPEAIAMGIHDILTLKGYRGFFDTDSVAQMSESALEDAIKNSSALVVFMHDETCESEWCVAEWKMAQKHMLDCIVVADVQRCSKEKLLSAVTEKDCRQLLAHQWIEYTDSYRSQAIEVVLEQLNAILVRIPGRLSRAVPSSPTQPVQVLDEIDVDDDVQLCAVVPSPYVTMMKEEPLTIPGQVDVNDHEQLSAVVPSP